ncbi:MAG: DUF1998 domain-containing protein [Chloroherpetonaceae bacterium]|nr:DUF1998 domain-containing protein [Chloroherpetonaceae bacterium]
MSDRLLRRSSLIMPFGVGAIVNFPGDESLMTAGLDAWPFATEKCPSEFRIEEERLRRRLGMELRLPPDYRIPKEGVQHANLRIPFVRFPRWHYCPLCGSMEELGLFGERQYCNGHPFFEGASRREKLSAKRTRMIPVRFIAVCERGHIQDFPFLEWVHQGVPVTPECRIIRLRAGGASASLGGIRIECTCGQKRTLSGSFAEDALEKSGILCRGERPWLGDTDGDVSRCGLPLRAVQRGASNVYFPYVVSSIYLPPSRKQQESGRSPVRSAEAKEDFHAEEEEYRRAEYRVLREEPGDADTDLYTTIRMSGEYDRVVAQFFSRITLVHKLRETRAFCGFSRYRPEDGRSLRERIEDLRRNPDIRWLPATVVRGEGLFFELDFARVAAWREGNRSMMERYVPLEERYQRTLVERGRSPRPILPEFVLIHTLAHLLIARLSYECGYGSASLRERLYCGTSRTGEPMLGFLIYTASGDSEGTMGGLVRQGLPGRIEPVLLRALQRATWCSYDPTCMESQGQGPDSCNLAACHGCAILSETSCENGNRLLDRAMVVGLPEDPAAGLFGTFLAEITGGL